MPLGDFFIENFQQHIFLALFVTQDLCIDHYQVQKMKEKFPPQFFSFFQMNNVTASGLISSHYTCSPILQQILFYDVPPLTMVHEQVHLHGQWLGKRHQECPSTGWRRGDPVGVEFFAFFHFSSKCLFRHFFFVGHHYAYSLCFTTP
jgi:hypothetical protein